MRAIAACLVALCGASAASNGAPSRAVAAAKIRQALKLPEVISGTVPTGTLYLCAEDEPRFRALLDADVLTGDIRPYDPGYGNALGMRIRRYAPADAYGHGNSRFTGTIRLAPAGEALVMHGAPANRPGWVPVRFGTRDLVEVTKIRLSDSKQEAVVDSTWKYVEVTPFGLELSQIGTALSFAAGGALDMNVHTAQAMFQKSDDGWRVVQ